MNIIILVKFMSFSDYNCYSAIDIVCLYTYM